MRRDVLKTEVPYGSVAATPVSAPVGVLPVSEDPLTAAVTAFIRRKGLSRREGEVLLRFIAAGKSNKEIAIELGIAYPTVKLYWTRACRKIGCENAHSAVLALLRDSLQEDNVRGRAKTG